VVGYWALLGLEAVRAMPPEEMRVALIAGAGRCQNAPGLVDLGAHAGRIIYQLPNRKIGTVFAAEPAGRLSGRQGEAEPLKFCHFDVY
jgi:hypothetical protein